MRVLLDTNIVIHRESVHVLHEEIGVLFRWLDTLQYSKYIHPVTVQEINKLKASPLRNLMNVKLEAYHIIQVHSPIHPVIQKVSASVDKNENDKNDTILLNELYLDRVDLLITEDRKIGKKATLLGISERVFTIDAFLEKVTAENPGLADYKVLAVKKELFGHIQLDDPFFESFKEDYPGFEKWFNRKSEETAYVCRQQDHTTAFLYLKVETDKETYADITPTFTPKKRLKIGTFKVVLNGYKLGERFLKIVFDNAIRYAVDEIYVTIFDKRIEQQRLIKLLEDYGFAFHGYKQGQGGQERVYVRDMHRRFNAANPRFSYPYFSRQSRTFFVPIYPAYHTQLFPDSILRTESPDDFVENEPFRNAISKVYVSRSYFKALRAGDVVVFYRTGGFYQGVATTIGIVESIETNIRDANQFVRLCRKRSVFSDAELMTHWNYTPNNRPFIVNFLYAYSLPKRPNLKKLIDIGVVADVNSVPRGFEPIQKEAFERLLQESNVDARLIVD
jgi:predicted nucleic acid-binding protein